MNELKQLRELVVTIEGLLAVLSVRPTDDMAQNALNNAYLQFKECYENLFNPETSVHDEHNDSQDYVNESVSESVEEAEKAGEEEPVDFQDVTSNKSEEIPSEPEQKVEEANPVNPHQDKLDEAYPADFYFSEPDVNVKPVEENTQKDANVIISDESQPANGEQLRVDEMLSRRGAVNLRNAFTLNDKFRFRRSLFNNSDAEFVDSIDIINAMNSFEEAQSYLYDDLGLEENNVDVQDFVSIIRNHFCV